MKPEVSHTYPVKAEQQADGTWKAWAVGVSMVVYAKTETKAIQVVDTILGDSEEDQEKE